MPCRQADCLRGYRKRGREGRGWVQRGGELRFTGYNFHPSKPKHVYGNNPYPSLPLQPPSPSCRVLVFLLVLICPQCHFPASPQSHFHYLPPAVPLCPFYKAFIISKTANFSLVCERRNSSSPILF